MYLGGYRPVRRVSKPGSVASTGIGSAALHVVGDENPADVGNFDAQFVPHLCDLARVGYPAKPPSLPKALCQVACRVAWCIVADEAVHKCLDTTQNLDATVNQQFELGLEWRASVPGVPRRGLGQQRAVAHLGEEMLGARQVVAQSMQVRWGIAPCV